MAEKKQEIKTVFSVVSDQASKALKELRKNFKVTEATLKDFTDNAMSLGAMTFVPLAGVMASLGATIANSLSSFVEYSTGVGDLAAKIGASAQDLQRFQYAAQMSGSSAEEISSAIEILGKNLGQVNSGKNKAIPEMFKQLGVSLYSANGELKTATELLPEIANCMRSQSTAAQKSYIATTLFGKAGQGLIQMLEGGSEGLNELTQEAENFGIVLSNDTLDVAGDYDDSLNRMQYALNGVQYSIANQVLPVLTPLVNSLTECISANREWIASSIADVAKDVAESLKKIDFKECITGAVNFAKNAYELFNKLGGLKTVGIATASIFGLKVVLSFTSAASSLLSVFAAAGKLTSSFLSLGAAFAPLGAKIALLGGQLAGLAYGGLMSIIGVLGKAVVALSSFGLTLLANPLTWIIGGIALAIGSLAYAGYKLYENWDEVCAWVQSLWQDLLNWFEPKIDAFVGVWERVKQLPEMVVQKFSGLADKLKVVWENIKSYFFAPFQAAYENMAQCFDSVKSWGSGVWDKVTGFFGSDDNTPSPAPLPADALAASAGGRMEGTMDIKIHTDEGTTAEVVRSNTSNNLKTKVDTGNMRGSYVPV